MRVLVGSTYEQTVLRAAAHHTVIMLYAPWCSHSKRLSPEWLALAQRYKGDGELVVAKLDASRRVQKKVGSGQPQGNGACASLPHGRPRRAC